MCSLWTGWMSFHTLNPRSTSFPGVWQRSGGTKCNAQCWYFQCAKSILVPTSPRIVNHPNLHSPGITTTVPALGGPIQQNTTSSAIFDTSSGTPLQHARYGN